MAIVVYPLNNIDFTAEDVGIYNSTRTSGIYAGDDFAISLSGLDNTISIDVGIAWMRLSRFFGVAVAHKTKTSVDMGLPNASFPRIDALVLRFDANKNSAELVSKQGTASSAPKPPEVSRTGAYHELHLLHVRRNAGAAVISAADVTDLRLNEQYCGLMADAVTKVDTLAINAQVTALIEELRRKLGTVEEGDYYASKEYVKDTVTEAVKEAAPYNYVNNSDFTQFVAQAGIGGNHGTQAYAGDRWILDSGTVTGNENESGNGYSNITLNGTIRQIVANPPDEGTAAIEMVSGTATITYDNGEVTITSEGGVIKNAQLFNGAYTADNLPAYQPKGYGAELTECMRYYIFKRQNLGANMLRFKNRDTKAAIDPFSSGMQIPFPMIMRITPTVKFWYDINDSVIGTNVPTFVSPFGFAFPQVGFVLNPEENLDLQGYEASADL